MRTASYSTGPAIGASGAAVEPLRARFGPLALIVAAHALLIYGIYSGLAHRAPNIAVASAVTVSFVAAPSAPAPARVAPADVRDLAPPAMLQPLTVVVIAPLHNAIGAPAAIVGDSPAAGAATPAGAAAEPAPPAPAAPRIVTSGVEYIRAPQPDYPLQSTRLGEQGKVVLRVLVDEQGLPAEVVVQTSSGFARLDEAGRQAALHALFKPHREDGRPVAVFVIVPLDFQLAR